MSPRGRGGLRSDSQQSVALDLNLFELLQDQLDAVQFAADLRFQVRRQGAPIAGPQLLQPDPTVAAQGRVVADALDELPLIRFTCATRSAISVLCSRQISQRSSSAGVGGLTIEQTRGSPRL